MRELAIGICQLTSEIGSADHDPRPANLEKATRAIAETAHQGAKLIVFGEIYLNGYETNEFTPLYAIAESEDDPYVAHLIEAAQQHDAHIIMGASTHKGAFPGQSYNSALLIGPTGLIGVYSKTHVASFAFDGRVAAEKAWWCPGGEIPVFDTPLGRIGIEICYDNSFPEVSRTLTLKGAEIILHVSLVGRQRDFDLFGWSRIFSPKGDVVFEAPRNEEAVAVARIDLDELYRARGQMAPFYNRNPELYRVIAES